MEVNLVWFKKDLRLFDHEPLFKAIADARLNKRSIFLVYLFEPSIMEYPDYSSFHHQFIIDSLQNLNQRLKKFKAHINVFNKDAHNFFNEILDDNSLCIKNIFAHEETGNGLSFLRDEKVRSLFKNKNVNFIESSTNGIIRGKWKKNWRDLWFQKMQSAYYHPSFDHISFLSITNELPKIDINHHLQRGGETLAHFRLKDFLKNNLKYYRQSISKPELAIINCSRLSPYLSFGNISIKQIYKSTLNHASYDKYKKNADAFIDRLMWHCHFIQRFEHFSHMEFENLNENFNSIRTFSDKVLHEKFIKGQTGFPMIDASIRCLKATGYINFRMRSMLISFYTHHLWQPWMNIAHFLAQNFLDYEPGIHYSQIQMQAGTMGIHTLRIYNPILQGCEQDPLAHFIKKWIPELKNLPTNLAHEPWKITNLEAIAYDFNLERDYYLPMIDYKSSAEYARKKLWEIKNQEETKFFGKKILKKRSKVQKAH